MKILLILAHTDAKPKVLNQFIFRFYYPSLTLEQLVAITPEKYNLEVVDGRYQEINYNWDGDIVGISCRTIAAKTAYRISDEFRKRGKTVVLGGWHPSLMPKEAKEHADAVVIGEAEYSWPQLLDDFENKKLKEFYETKAVDPEDIACPKRLNKKNTVTAPIQASRGCPYGCSFCPVNKLQGRKLRTRPIKNVIEEIKSANSNRLFFVDNSLTINPEYTKNLFSEMIDLGKKFSCYGNIDVLGSDDELLKLAKKAGCDLWIVGLESVYQDTIDMIKKSTNLVDKYKESIKKIHDYNMMVQGLFIFGFDTDTTKVFNKTLNLIYDWKLDKAGFAILTPFPGTNQFDEFEKQGRILSKDWSKYNLKNVVFEPKNMTPDQLYNGTNKILNEFYSYSNLIKRNIQDKNITFNKIINRSISEISSKQLYKILGF